MGNDGQTASLLHAGTCRDQGDALGSATYFAYDAELRRYAIEESTGLRYFTWDENGMNLLCERDTTGGGDQEPGA